MCRRETATSICFSNTVPASAGPAGASQQVERGTVETLASGPSWQGGCHVRAESHSMVNGSVAASN